MSSEPLTGQIEPASPQPGAHSHAAPALPESVDAYDTTLRDGSQQEGLSLTVEDKLAVARQLDHLGVAYIEGGWPGANPKDDEFFRRAGGELALSSATLVAFGSTRRPGGPVASDPTLRHLAGAGTSVVCIVAKTWDFHVREALRTTLDEAVAMAKESVAWLRGEGLRVFFDAEHFFDGYRSDPDFALAVLDAAAGAGAEALVLCDTNGGSLPDYAEEVVSSVRQRFGGLGLGVHFHNDSGCAVANTLAGVRAGATQVQGCVNGYGERAGNADLVVAIPNLSIKMGVRTIPPGRLERLQPGGPPLGRVGEHRSQSPTALRGRLGLCPQGRSAHQRHSPVPVGVRAHTAGPGGKRDPHCGERAVRALDDRLEGRRAGP